MPRPAPKPRSRFRTIMLNIAGIALALLLASLIVLIVYNNVTGKTAAIQNGKARDAAVAELADDVAKSTQNGITIQDAKSRPYEWHSDRGVIVVGVRLGVCDFEGQISSPEHPNGANDLDGLTLVLPGTLTKEGRAIVEEPVLIPLDTSNPEKAYAAIAASSSGYCTAGDARFQ